MKKWCTLLFASLIVLATLFYLLYYGKEVETDEAKQSLTPLLIPISNQTQPSARSVNQFGLTPPPLSSKWKQFNYTRLDMLMHRTIPWPDGFEEPFSSPCWYGRLNLKAAPDIFSLIGDISSGKMTREQAQSNVNLIEAKSNYRRLICLPNVFVPSFPKSGSTSLFNFLVKHPFIQSPTIRATHYFVRFPFNNDNDLDYLSVFSYLKNFDLLGNCSKMNHRCLSVDASQSLLWDTRTSTFLDELPLLIKHTFSQPKFIVMLREPVKRFHSDFWFFTKQCVGNAHKFWQNIGPSKLHELTTSELENIQGCLQKNISLEVCVHYSLVNAPYMFKNCGEVRPGVGVYYAHITRWLRAFPSSSFRFLRMEDFIAHPSTTMKELWDFLDIPPIEEAKFKVDDMQPPDTMSYPDLLPKTKAALTEFYKPFNRMLADLLGDDKFLWQDVTS